MSVPALAGKLVAPGWETEFGGLLAQLVDLPPAARLAIAQVVRSVLAEGCLEPEEVASAFTLLEAIEVSDATGQQSAARRAQAARHWAAELRDDAQALRAQAAVQRRRSRRIEEARRHTSADANP
jgi:hypothetical protein